MLTHFSYGTGILIILFLVMSDSFSDAFADSKSSTLAGKNLMIIPLPVLIQFRFNDTAKLREHMPRPAKPQVDILDWLIHRYNFTFTVLTTNETTLERPLSSGNRGSLSYLLDGTCDLVLGSLVVTNGRYRLIGMPFPWLQRSLYFIMPVSDPRANFSAVLKPFQFPVWFLFGISIVVVVGVLESYILYFESFKIQSKHEHHQTRALSSPAYLYVTGVILSQGGSCLTRKITIRIVAGIWCLACFVLVQAYTCTLIPYVIAPNNEPLIKSAYDIGKNEDIHLLVEKNFGIDVLFSGASEDSGIFRILRDRINMYPDSRCDLEKQCIEKVGSGGPYVYTKGMEYLLDAMLVDFKKTGKCRMQIAKEGFTNVFLSFALPKHSPYIKSFSEGVIEMNAFGLIEHWVKLYEANPYQCLGLDRQRNKQSVNPRLSLKNLTGAFIVLAFGYITSLLVFVSERFQFTPQ